MRRTSVLFLGNCQAQAFESLCGHLNLPVDVILAPPVWKITPDDQGDLEGRIASADILFCQRLRDNYPIEFLRYENLVSIPSTKIVRWPNIYFDGYFPGIQYIYRNGSKIEGPLSDYHFQWIFDGWKNGESVTEVASSIISADGWAGRFDSAETAIANLREREKSVDVQISDYILNNFRTNKLFYTMNHPTTPTLAEMLRRLFSYVGVNFQSDDIASYPYNLNQIEIPAFPFFHSHYRPIFDDINHFKGVRVRREDGQAASDTVNYQPINLVETYFQQYERFIIDEKFD